MDDEKEWLFAGRVLSEIEVLFWWRADSWVFGGKATDCSIEGGHLNW